MHKEAAAEIAKTEKKVEEAEAEANLAAEAAKKAIEEAAALEAEAAALEAEAHAAAAAGQEAKIGKELEATNATQNGPDIDRDAPTEPASGTDDSPASKVRRVS